MSNSREQQRRGAPAGVFLKSTDYPVLVCAPVTPLLAAVAVNTLNGAGYPFSSGGAFKRHE